MNKNENHILNSFQGYNITLNEFKELLKSRVGEPINLELLDNKRYITAQWYDNLEVNYFKDAISFEEGTQDKPPMNIIIGNIKEILEGKHLYNSHLLVKMNNGQEYFIWAM